MPTTTRLYALVDHRLSPSLRLAQVIEFYGSREKADEALGNVLSDEPTWAGSISVAQSMSQRPDNRDRQKR